MTHHHDPPAPADPSHQVAQAASLVVAPHTAPTTRQAASAFLESWTQSPVAWDMYGPWLASFVQQQQQQHDNPAVPLLCLQLLQAKMRRELPSHVHAQQQQPQLPASAASLEAIRHALTQLILTNQQPPQQSTLLSPACMALVALQVRMASLESFLPALISAATATRQPLVVTTTLQPSTALKLLAQIPTELEACLDLQSHVSYVTAALTPHWPSMQAVVASHLEVEVSSSSSSNNTLAAVHVLSSWVRACHVTLSQLNHAPPGATTRMLLPRLVHFLAQPQYTTACVDLVTAVAQCLTVVLRQPADSCTPQRRAALVALVEATSRDGFVGASLQCAGDNDALTHALVMLLTTLVTEDIDEIIALPADGLLSLLLDIQQTHPSVRIRSLVLEVWLTVQDVPLQERHEHWRHPLTSRILDTLCHALQYPVHFSSWEEEIHVEQEDFDEYRRLAPDVLIGCYHLLRKDYVQRMTRVLLSHSHHHHHHHHAAVSWTQREAALFALTAASREVCGRVKTNMGGTRILQDQQETAILLQHVATHLVATSHTSTTTSSTTTHQLSPQQLPALYETQCRFLGAYSSIWAKVASPELVSQILDHLQTVLAHTTGITTAGLRASAAQALKSILTVSSTRLLEGGAASALQQFLPGLFALALQTNEEDVMLPVGEGCVRLLARASDAAIRDPCLVALAKILTDRGHEALNLIPNDGSSLSQQSESAMNALQKYLKVMVVMIKFAPSDQMLETALHQFLWPFLESVSQRMQHYEALMDSVLGVKQQLLRSAPDWLATQFTASVENWVRVFEQTKKPSIMAYLSSAVEAYGAQETKSFENLLDHVSKVLLAYISSEKPAHECTDLLESYFELCQRYLLFAAGSMAQCETLPSIVSSAVECLTACHGERNATRATLNFLEKLVGWRRLPISVEPRQALEMASRRLDEIIAAHGQRLIQLCTNMFVGGPRMLWPPAGDVLFAVVLASVAWPVPESADSCVARQWLENVSLADRSAGTNVKNEQAAQMYRQVVGELLALAQKGPAMKGKAKLLLSDFSLVMNGQNAPETLGD